MGKWGGWGIVILASYKIHFIRVHDILVWDPGHNKSILIKNIPNDIILTLICH